MALRDPCPSLHPRRGDSVQATSRPPHARTVPDPRRSPLSDDAPELLRALAREDDEHPLARKLVVAPAAGAGREVLRALARARGGWTGFEVTTVRPLAVRCATEWIASEGVRVLDAFEEEAHLDEALDAALDDAAHAAAFGELAEGPGFRRAVREALKALRLTGVGPREVEAGTFEDRRKQFLLAAVLRRYEARLESGAATDVAGVLDRAARALDRGARIPAGRILLLPGLGLRGRAGRFVRALQARGAVVLAADPVEGMAPPRGLLWAAGPVRSPLSRLLDDVGVSPPAPAPVPAPPPDAAAGLPLFDQAPAPAPGPERGVPDAVEPAPDLHLFRAAGVHEELREVLRRVMASGRPWDDVEIVTPDPGVYGPALHTLCARLGIDTTFAVGLPVGRTRPGRAVSAWLRWVADDGPSPILRRLLQTADLVAPGRRAADSPFLARTLRELRIGWGRTRYRPLIAAALQRARTADPEGHRHRSAERERERLDRTIRNLEALDRLLATMLDAAPDPRRDASPAEVARGLAAFLALVPAESEVDRSAHERLLRVLDRIEATLRRRTRFSTALAAVREHLEIRVPAPRAEGRAPWLADGGAVHLSDVEHGGLSGRPLLFVVGMDAGRFPGGGRPDPFLLDGERRSLHGDLPLTDDRIDEQRFRFAALLARARGTVTVSYPAWDAGEARLLQPASVVLTLFRAARGDRSLGYGDLERHLDAPASRVPRGFPAVDTDDVWLGALAAQGRLVDGRRALRSRFEALDRGLDAAEAPFRPDPSPRVGMVAVDEARRARLDPRSPGGPTLSASGLEALGTCPLRYFYSRVLGVRKPDDPEFDLERWLPASDRGLVLHDVYQAAVDEARTRSLAFDSDAFRAAAREHLRALLERKRLELPPPSDAVFEAETVMLRADVDSFCAHLAGGGFAPDQVVATEFALGGDEPATLALPDGSTLRIRGRIDRLDRLPTGLRVVDYKTGSTWAHGPDKGVYHGGRRLQHVVYARAVEGILPDEPPVAAVEYHFPTVRGQNESYVYPAGALSQGLDLVTDLVRLAADGRFPATDDPGDCRYCDYAPVCRAGSVTDDDDRDSTPRIEWTRARLADGHEAVRELGRVRTHDDGGLS